MLAAALTTVDAIVSHLYRGLPDAILPAARLAIQAHLEKLEEDARA